MALDIVKHEEDKLRYLTALYDIAVEYHAKIGASCRDPASVRECEGAIGERAGLERGLSERISAELDSEGLVEWVCSGQDGPEMHLTRKGVLMIEKAKYDRTMLAKRRWAISLAKDGAIVLSRKAAVAILTFFAGLLGLATFKEQIAAWIKRWLGL